MFLFLVGVIVSVLCFNWVVWVWVCVVVVSVLVLVVLVLVVNVIVLVCDVFVFDGGLVVLVIVDIVC